MLVSKKEAKTLEAEEAWVARYNETVNFQIVSYKIQTSKTRQGDGQPRPNH